MRRRTGTSLSKAQFRVFLVILRLLLLHILLSKSNLIYVPTIPVVQSLPPGIIESKSNFICKGYGVNPVRYVVQQNNCIVVLNFQDLKKKAKYLVTFTVGWDQRYNINAAINKDFQILLFHYDGQTSEWDEFEWSRRAIHVSVRKQTKWCYAKRFMHPDIVATYDYIFIWNEDLGVEHSMVKKWQCREANGFLLSRERMAVLPSDEWTLCFANVKGLCLPNYGCALPMPSSGDY
ncbi:hypothetical protein HYC85_003519 [Camellia sinensis]|uniref:Uncharacterized protein n=1 Tax=Camellia sinensis TaxID=4442 RepID=A0A7J7HW37_CAMSI|nr:hypothetical protein HYC85_003519 [Camellia sinensis]